MGNSERLFADSAGLTSDDVAQLARDVAKDGLPQLLDRSAPIHGHVLRHGQVIPFTLDASQLLPEPRGIMIEQIVIAALLMASFIGPIYRLVS